MWPHYHYVHNFKLPKDDVEGIQSLYGKTSFSVVNKELVTKTCCSVLNKVLLVTKTSCSGVNREPVTNNSCSVGF